MWDILATHDAKIKEISVKKEKIIEALRPYNLSRVAREIGVHRQTLYRLVHEKTAPSPMLEKALIEYLGLDASQ